MTADVNAPLSDVTDLLLRSVSGPPCVSRAANTRIVVRRSVNHRRRRGRSAAAGTGTCTWSAPADGADVEAHGAVRAASAPTPASPPRLIDAGGAHAPAARSSDRSARRRRERRTPSRFGVLVIRLQITRVIDRNGRLIRSLTRPMTGVLRDFEEERSTRTDLTQPTTGLVSEVAIDVALGGNGPH